jgi:hypothetical protein
MMFHSIAPSGTDIVCHFITTFGLPSCLHDGAAVAMMFRAGLGKEA